MVRRGKHPQDTWAAWILIAFMVVMPIILNERSALITQIKLMLGMITGLAILTGWLARSTPTNQIVWRRNPVFLPIAAYLIVILLSALATPFKWASLQEWARQFFCLLLFWAGWEFFRSRALFRRFAQANAATAILLSCYAIGQWQGIVAYEWSRSIRTGLFATMGHPSLFASYLGMMLGVTLALLALDWQTEQHGRAARNRGISQFLPVTSASWVLLAGAASICVGIALTQSLGAAVGLLCASLYLLIVWGNHRRGLRIAVVAVVVAVVIAGMFLTPMGKKFFHFNNFRMLTWRGAANAAIERPLGTGLGTFSIYFPKYRGSMFLRTLPIAENVINTHNEYLQMAAEIGPPGIAIWFWILTASGALLFSYRRRITVHRERIAVDFLAAGLMMDLAHNGVSVNMRWDAPALTFWLLLGVTLAAARIFAAAPARADSTDQMTGSIGVRQLTPGAGKALLALAIFASACALFYGSRVTLSNMAYLEVETALYNYQTPTPGYDANVPNPLIEQLFAKTLGYWPWNMPAKYDLGYYYSISGQPAKAVTVYEEIRAIHPYYQRIWRNLGHAYINVGRFADAERIMTESLQYNDCEKNRFILAMAIDYQNDPNRAAEAYTYVLELSLDFLSRLAEKRKLAPEGYQQVNPENYDEVVDDTNQAFIRLREALVKADDSALVDRLQQRLLTVDPANEKAKVLKAWTLQDQKRYPEAKASYYELVTAAPELSLAWANLGEVSFQMGDLHEAAAAFENAIRLNPDQPLIRGRLDQVRHSMDAATDR